MLTAALYGLGTALPLLIGAGVGLRYNLPRPLLAALMAFGAGTMVAAVSTELFQPAFETEGIWGQARPCSRAHWSTSSPTT